MAPDRDTLVGLLREIVLSSASRNAKLQNIASIIKASGNYRWVGLYTVDRQAGQVINLVWSGPGAPEYPAFPIGKGLTGAAIVQRRTINVGDVAGDPCYLTAFGSTRSEIIVPVFDEARENVVGTIDLESEQANAFGADEQTLLEVCSEVIQPLWRS